MTGLNSDFSIVDGSLALSSDADKAADEIWFLMNFDKFRLYLPDYDPGVAALQQKAVSFLLQFKNVILGRLTKLLAKYASNSKIVTIDLVYATSSRNEYGVFIEHAFISNNDSTITVKFIG